MFDLETAIGDRYEVSPRSSRYFRSLNTAATASSMMSK
jgi:hypothetical protein